MTDRERRIIAQPFTKAHIELIVMDKDHNIVDTIEGLSGGGSLNIDTGSSVRRTSSFTIIPSKQISDISERSLIWLDKSVKVRIGIEDPYFNNEILWYSQGWYAYVSASYSLDSSAYTLTIELSDMATKLDGTIIGQIGGALETVLPAYEEDPDSGAPLKYNSIKGAIEKTLDSAGLYAYGTAYHFPSPDPYDPDCGSYIVEDVGEYYAMPQYNPNWQEYRDKHPLWNMIPYDLEFSTGAAVWELISTMAELYPNYDAAYDENGIFRVRMIPSSEDEPYAFHFEDFKDTIISESRSIDLTTIRNICEVWGESMDADWYSEKTGYTTQESYHITFDIQDKDLTIKKQVGVEQQYDSPSIATYEKTLKTYNFTDTWKDFEIKFQNKVLTITSTYNTLYEGSTAYPAGAVIYTYTIPEEEPQPTPNTEEPQSEEPSVGDAPEEIPEVDIAPMLITLTKPNNLSNVYTFSCEGYGDKYSTGTRFATKFVVDSCPGQLMRINDLEPLAIIDMITKEPIDTNRFNIAEFPDRIHVFQVVREQDNDAFVPQIYYMGVSQSHALDVLTDGTTGALVEWKDPRTEEVFLLPQYSKEYYKKFLNCENISMTIIPDSPFTVQKIGERIDVKSSGEFQNITSDDLALERAQYENWKNSRLTDTIDLTTKLMPFVVPYTKIDYKRSGDSVRNDYIIKSVSHDLDNGTTTINMYTFYPLYKANPGDTDRMTYDYMAGFKNEDLYGDQDALTSDTTTPIGEGE